jgi:hypothetical protein
MHCLAQRFKAKEANETAMDSNFRAVQSANLDFMKSGAKIGITAAAFERDAELWRFGSLVWVIDPIGS